jgi:DeoR family ulaG and ulaABCDEF operon transcriptional repressor
MQTDPVLVAAERRLIERADEIVLLADSSKFQRASGHVVCDLHMINTVVTDANVSERDLKMLEGAGARVVIAH